MKEWMTTAEIVSTNLAGLASTVQKVNVKARDAGWRSAGPTKARKRAGRGGGWEYHISVLPEAAQADWQKRRELALAKEAPALVPVSRDVEPVTSLSARRRRVMEARAQVLAEIRRRVIVEETSQRQAILALVAEFKADAQLPEHQRGLPAPLFDACGNANDKGNGLGKSQVFAWIKSATEGGVASLAPKSTRPKSSDDAWPWLPRLLRFYARPGKPSLTRAHKKLLASGLVNEAVSYDQCKRAVASLAGTAKYLDAHRGREGYIQLKSRMAFKRRDTSMLDPTSVYISDGKTFDAEVSHPIHGGPFKPEITSILDVATRRCVGWSVGLAENSDGVADALRMAVEQHGIPAIFYSDRGPGYRNARMDGPVYGLCARLGVTPTHSLPYNSQARGIIERFNGTVWNPEAEDLPSYLGAKMDREAAQRFHKASRRDLKEFGSSSVLPGWSAFIEQVGDAVEAYNAAPHSALRTRDPQSGRWIDRSPDQVWDMAVQGGVEVFALEPGEADDLFRPHVIRTARRGEVNWLTNTYFSPDLQPFDGMKVAVGYDIHDAKRVWVRRVDEAHAEAGELICIADFAGNATHYMPRSMHDKAVRTRSDGRLRRAHAKVHEIEAEARGAMLIDHAPQAPVEIPLPDLAPVAEAVVLSAEPAPVAAPEPNVVTFATPTVRYTDDFDLARDAVAGEVELTKGYWEILLGLLRSPPARELLDYHGIDEASLRQIVRESPHNTN